MRNNFFHYPHTLPELNLARACPALSEMRTECAEIALAWSQLNILFDRFQFVSSS